MVDATNRVHAQEVGLAHVDLGLVLELHAVDKDVGQLLRVRAIDGANVEVANLVDVIEVGLVDLANLTRLSKLLHHESTDLALIKLLLLYLLLSWRSIVVEWLTSVGCKALVLGMGVEPVCVGGHRGSAGLLRLVRRRYVRGVHVASF